MLSFSSFKSCTGASSGCDPYSECFYWTPGETWTDAPALPGPKSNFLMARVPYIGASPPSDRLTAAAVGGADGTAEVLDYQAGGWAPYLELPQDRDWFALGCLVSGNDG